MIVEFEDILIVDLELAKTTWSRVHSSMRTLYLRLSREPDHDWARFFHEERESRVVIKRHGLWIEDGYIVFDCLLEDVERHHLPDFGLSLEYANQRSRELQQARRDERAQRHAEVRSEQEDLIELQARIRAGSAEFDASIDNPPENSQALAAAPECESDLASPEIAQAPDVPLEATPEPAPELLPMPEPSPEPTQDANAPELVQQPAESPEPSAPPPAPAVTDVSAEIAEFAARRAEWRARFREAMATSRAKESSRDND